MSQRLSAKASIYSFWRSFFFDYCWYANWCQLEKVWAGCLVTLSNKEGGNVEFRSTGKRDSCACKRFEIKFNFHCWNYCLLIHYTTNFPTSPRCFSIDKGDSNFEGFSGAENSQAHCLRSDGNRLICVSAQECGLLRPVCYYQLPQEWVWFWLCWRCALRDLLQSMYCGLALIRNHASSQ